MSERDTRLYVEDMIEFCGKALTYSSTLTEATLTADAMRYDHPAQSRTHRRSRDPCA